MSKQLLLCLCLLFSGCVRGWIYTNTTEPYCLDMEDTPVSSSSGSSGLKSISIPRIPGARTLWSSNAIADAATREGITQIHYCDRKVFSVLGGIWGSDSIVVYGEQSQAELEQENS